MRRAARGYVIDHSILITPREPPAFPPSDPMHLAESVRTLSYTDGHVLCAHDVCVLCEQL